MSEAERIERETQRKKKELRTRMSALKGDENRKRIFGIEHEIGVR
jgi:hypothetical protein